MRKSKDWIRLLKNKAFEDKATNLKINNIDIDKILSNKDINRKTICHFNCKCKNYAQKKLRTLLETKYGIKCNKCTELIRRENIKNSHNNRTKEQIDLSTQKKKETIKKFNEANPNRQNEINIKNQKNKNETEKKLNEANPDRQKLINQTRENTNKKLNVENPNRPNVIKQKISNTNKKLNDENPNRPSEIKQKISNTNKKLNDENPNRPREILSKILKNSYLKKDYILPSGTITQVQGYEPIALDELFENNYKEDDIITQYQGIEYEFENNTHKYYADIYIKSENKIIEVKSDFTMEKEYDKNMAKWEACVDLGYEFEFWIYDKKKNKEVLKL